MEPLGCGPRVSRCDSGQSPFRLRRPKTGRKAEATPKHNPEGAKAGAIIAAGFGVTPSVALEMMNIFPGSRVDSDPPAWGAGAEACKSPEPDQNSVEALPSPARDGRRRASARASSRRRRSVADRVLGKDQAAVRFRPSASSCRRRLTQSSRLVSGEMPVQARPPALEKGGCA